MQRKYTIFSLQLLVCLIIAMSGCTSVITKIDRAEANIESCMLGKLEDLGNQPLSYFISERGDPTEKSLDILDSCSTPYQYSWEDWLGSFHNKRMTACHFDHWPSDYIVFYVDINYVDNIGGDTTDGGSACDPLPVTCPLQLIYFAFSNSLRMSGGAGADTFFLAPGGEDNVIRDFGRGADKIDLTAFEDIR